MSKVALVGFAPNTLDAVLDTDADEIWSLAWAYKYTQIPFITRLFEMHPIHFQAQSVKPMYVKPRAHLEYLRRQESFNVYMLDEYEDVPKCVRYPIEEVTDMLLSRWTRSGERMHLFTSSMDYMMALAIHEGFDEIELIGVEMSSDSEYRYQREGMYFWAGVAIGRGIALTQHAPTQLLYKPLRYGYDGFQMIYRQDLERLKEVYKNDHENALHQLQFQEGQFANAQKVLADHDRSGKGPGPYRDYLEKQFNELGQAMERKRVMVTMNAAGLKVLDYLIREVDLEEENDPHMHYPFSSMPVEAEKEQADVVAVDG